MTDRLTSKSDMKLNNQGSQSIHQMLHLSNMQKTLATTAVGGQNLPLSGILSKDPLESSKYLSLTINQKNHLKNTTGRSSIKDTTYQIDLNSFNDYNLTRNIEGMYLKSGANTTLKKKP